MQRKISGFTLIEISITLVILGLLTGGILVGKDLIRSAELRSMATELEKYKAAINTFRLKYNAIPGDMKDAESIWGTSPDCNWGERTDGKTCNGNGDTFIGSPTNDDILDTAYSFEYYSFWQHLSNAKLISGLYTGGSTQSWGYGAAEPGINTPILKNGACVSVFRWNTDPSGTYPTYYQNTYKTTFYVGLPYPDDICYMPAFTPTDALSIDLKIDDGLPATGGVVTLTPNWSVTADCATTTDATTARYKTSSKTVNCNLMFPRISP